jgi:glycine dehydrogenase subunit 1
LVERLTQVPGVSRVFDRPVFHEAVLRLPRPASEVLDGLLARGILGGFDLNDDYPELGHALLVCATETREEADLQRYAAALAALP